MRIDEGRRNRLEEQLTRIPNVEAAALHLDDDGAIAGVDIVADRGRAPQRIVRDVEIVLRQDGIEIDHRKIGVAALSDPSRVLEEPRSAPGPVASPAVRPADRDEASDEDPRMAVIELVQDPERVRLVAVHSTTRGGAFAVEVELAVGAYEGLPGRAEGPASEPVGCAALVARATIEAVRNLLQPGHEIQLRELRMVDMAGTPMVAVTVDFGRGRQTNRLAGACLQHGSLYDTAVYATLDAINRPLGRARFRQLAVVENEGRDAARRRA